MRTPKSRQKATALLSALFIMTLVAIAATAMTLRIQLDIYRTQLIVNTDKLYLASQGVIFWGMDALSRKKNTLDKLGPQGQVADFPANMKNIYPGLQIEGHLYDLQAKFNLNNLQKKKSLVLFHNILERTLPKKNANEREGLSLAILDWISEYTLDKGKDEYQSWYLGQKPPYYASHQPFVSISELRLVKGVEARDYLSLSPVLTVLPEYTPVNVKTAPKAVLMGLKKDMSSSELEEILQAREALADNATYSQILGKLKISQDSITLSSSYFLAVAIVRDRELKLINYTILKREMEPRSEKVKVSLISESLNAI